MKISTLIEKAKAIMAQSGDVNVQLLHPDTTRPQTTISIDGIVQSDLPGIKEGEVYSIAVIIPH